PTRAPGAAASAEGNGARGRGAAGPAAGTDALDAETVELLARLRKLRRALADARGMPAYIVFNDATLHEMALRRPRSASELLDIPGVGPKKLEQYGTAFLAEIGDT
ncbi:MAG TPA: HRDC domain-containing protein, partial [Polyangia bacterium]|nr:HRDC domain-containing protein [Polyangia bacterium]